MISVRMYNWIRTCMLLCASKIASLLKLSFVLGSTGIMFSASNFCMPLVGLYNGVLGTSLIWSFLFGMRIIFAKITYASLAFYIPGYCAALYFWFTKYGSTVWYSVSMSVPFFGASDWLSGCAIYRILDYSRCCWVWIMQIIVCARIRGDLYRSCGWFCYLVIYGANDGKYVAFIDSPRCT